MRPTYHYRSFLWPALLILVGVIALLANTGQIPAERLYNLVNLWPLILVVIGLVINQLGNALEARLQAWRL